MSGRVMMKATTNSSASPKRSEPRSMCASVRRRRDQQRFELGLERLNRAWPDDQLAQNAVRADDEGLGHASDAVAVGNGRAQIGPIHIGDAVLVDETLRGWLRIGPGHA